MRYIGSLCLVLKRKILVVSRCLDLRYVAEERGVAAVVLGMWCAAGRHADAGVGIGMPALVFVKNEDYGYAKSQKKSVFAVFVFCKKFQKNVFFPKTCRRRLCYHQARVQAKAFCNPSL